MAKVDRERLRLLIGESGRSARSVSLAAGLGATGIKDILNGKSQDPKLHTVAAIAKQLAVPLDRLLKEGDLAYASISDGGEPPSGGEGAYLPIRGDVQAGAWLEVDDFDQTEPEFRPAPVDPRFPRSAQWLSRVRGDSMNALTSDGLPAGLIEGDLVQVVDAIVTAYVPRVGDIVEAERSRFEGREREVTLKQVEQAADGRWLLYPRSSNPRWREPLEFNADDVDGVTVRVRGKVLRMIRDF